MIQLINIIGFTRTQLITSRLYLFKIAILLLGWARLSAVAILAAEKLLANTIFFILDVENKN